MKSKGYVLFLIHNNIEIQKNHLSVFDIYLVRVNKQ